MVARSAAMRAQWAPGQVREVNGEMMSLTLGIVARTLFDHDPAGERDRIARALAAFRDLSGTANLLPAWLPLPHVRRMARALSDMDAIVYGLIDARRAEPDARLAARTDLLSALVQAQAEGEAGARMTRTELRDEILTLFLAGHETTAQTLTWTFYLLGQHPAVEAALHEELDTVLAGRLPTAADALPLTDRIVQEAMRLYPPVTTLARVATEDVELGGQRVPAGSDVACWLYFAQRDPRWWADPERFDPDRFLPGRIEQIPRGAYAPFGAGQRQCIGKHFALMEARLILATVAQRFTLRLVPGHRVEPRVAVTMSPRYGMPMLLRARERTPSAA
jgi:cytochrome P450